MVRNTLQPIIDLGSVQAPDTLFTKIVEAYKNDPLVIFWLIIIINDTIVL